MTVDPSLESIVKQRARNTRRALAEFAENALEQIHLTYSPMKVGSKSLYYAQRSVMNGGKCAHLHFLSDWGQSVLQGLIEKSRYPDPWRKQLILAKNLRAVFAARDVFLNQTAPLQSAGSRPYVIAAVRDPFSLHFATMFELFHIRYARVGDLTLDSLKASFTEDPWQDVADRFYRLDLPDLVGFDVLSRHFPISQGWEIYDEPAARVLIIRQENLSDLCEAIGALYDVDPKQVPMVSKNTRSTDHYRQSRAACRLPEETVSKILELPYVRHFYSSEEHAQMILDWKE